MSFIWHLLGPPVAMALALLAAPALAGPYGTSYVASVVNLPGTATAPLTFDGVATPLGSSGLVVGEKSTSFGGPYGGYELLEFSLRTADGEPFVGQQLASTEVARVGISGLQWLDDSSPATAIANSGFLWLTIDGVPQALSDQGSLGLVFGTHPLDPSIQIVFVDNIQTEQLGFETLGATAFEAFAALVGPILALDVDDVHLGVAAASAPEPGMSAMLLGGVLGLAGLARWRARRRAEVAP